MTRIDAHQHFWSPARGDYGWLTPDLEPLYRDFGPDDLRPLLDAAGMARCIAVQAAPTEAETAYLLGLKAGAPWIAGVVGWIDFGADHPHARLASLKAQGLVGVRPMLQDIDDPDYILRPAVAPVLKALATHGLVFDALIRTEHLSRIATLADRHPELTIVIDHAAKPVFGRAAFDDWAAAMREAAARPNIACKLSGLLTEAPPGADPDSLRPWVQLLLDAFGPGRLIWGSDWPVLTLAASYEHWMEMSEALLAGIGQPERAAIFGGNAARLYGLGS